jgi:hypothetical protein
MTQHKPFRELQPGEKTHPDYDQILSLFQQINRLTNVNQFSDNFSSDEWFSILGSWENCGMAIRAKCDYIERHDGPIKEPFDPGMIVDSLILNRHL